MDELELEYESLEKVPEQYRNLYKEDNGKAVLGGVKGMKTQADIDRVMGALDKERNDHKAAKAKLQQFGDLDPEDVQSKLDRIEELEAAAGGKIDEDKLNQMVEGRLKTKIAPVERELNKLKQERDTLATENETFKQNDIRRKVRNAIGKALSDSKGFLKEAEDDAIIQGERLFELNEDGTVTAKDGVGITPGITPKDWLAEIQSKKPHWWGSTGGTGARPGTGSFQGSDNPWSREHWNVTKQNQIYRENKQRAEQMAKAAGTSIGGTKAPEKK